MDVHQDEADDPQKVEYAAECGQWLLSCRVVEGFSRFEGGHRLLLLWQNDEEEQAPCDDGNQDGDVEVHFGLVSADIGKEYAEAEDRHDGRDVAVGIGDVVQDASGAERRVVTLCCLDHLGLEAGGGYAYRADQENGCGHVEKYKERSH